MLNSSALRCTQFKCARDIGLILEAVDHKQLVEVIAERPDFDALAVIDMRDVLKNDREQHDALVQHLVVLEVVHQRMRHAFEFGGEKYGSAGHARRRVPSDAIEKRFYGDGQLRKPIGQQCPSALPRRKQNKNKHRHRNREPAAVKYLRQDWH